MKNYEERPLNEMKDLLKKDINGVMFMMKIIDQERKEKLKGIRKNPDTAQA